MQQNRSELRQLIGRAVNETAHLLPLSANRGLSPMDLPHFLVVIAELQAAAPEAARSLALQYKPSDSIGRAKLSEYLRSLSSLDKYFDGAREYITCVGSPGNSLSMALPLSAISSKIIMSAIVNSIEVATDALYNFLETDSFPIRLVYLLTGTKVSKEIVLDDYCKIIPADDAISLVGLSADPPPGMTSLAKESLGCALVIEANVSPGTWNVDKDIAPVVHFQGLAKENIGLLCGIKTLVSQRQFYPSASTHIMDQVLVDTLPIVEHTPIGGWTFLNHLVPVLPSESTLPYLDTQEFRSLVSKYAACAEDVKRRLQIPISRFQSTTRRMGHTDRVIDLAIAFEAMLIDKYKQGVTKRLAERAAWLYAETEDEKSWAEKEMRSFYRHRSEIMHGEEVSENVELYSTAASIFVVCLKNIIGRRQFPNWGSVDVSGTIGNPIANDPHAVLSTKHDATSWTIGELKRIDKALSHHCKSMLQGVPPGSHANGTVTHTRDAQATIAELEGRNEAYVYVDPYGLRDAHPLWRESSEGGDEARTWHCGDDIRRHIRLWVEAALEKRLTVVIDDDSEFIRGHHIS